ncbi:MAG: ATP-binding protein [Bacteroidales bacterium]
MSRKFSFCLFILYISFCSFKIAHTAEANSDSVATWIQNQLNQIDDTIKVLKNAHQQLAFSKRENNETGLINAVFYLARFHETYGSLDSAIFYFERLKDLYKTTGNEKAVAETCLILKGFFGSKAEYAEALKQVYTALTYYEKANKKEGIALCYTHICDLLYYENKYEESVNYCDKAIAIQEQIDARTDLAVSLRYKASSLLFVEGALEEALKTINRAIEIYNETGEDGIPLLASLNGRGNILKYMKRYDEAIADYQFIYNRCLELGLKRQLIAPYANIGHVYLMQGKHEKALPYILETIEMIKKSGDTKNLWENYMHASDIYKELNDYKKALEYNLLYSDEYAKYLNTIIDRLESEAQIKYETAKKDEMITLQEAEIINQRNIKILYAVIAVLLVISLLGMMNSRKNIRRKRTEIEKSKEELQLSLENLKNTQAQLIHAEKMASLGELTAGIAHEIQNPLNFVNNFSEVNAELIAELKEEITNGNSSAAMEIVDVLLGNEEKIIHHGNRADSIVKGMLQHSRTTSTDKVTTDINALADEYLRLSYHGLRAKDKSFNADFKLEADFSIPKINVVPQDFGRVLLNLINNAFYAIDKKAKQESGDYKPSVIVRTKRLDNLIEISIADNGPGIPDEIKDKIFQPFFTTKPTGEGTGLGLSLSYDIITKGHGGKLNVNSEKGKGTEFIVQLPIN